MKKKAFFILLLTLLIVPTFLRMVRPGIFSTQDFHFFRLFEFDKCVKAGQIPCRWAPDAGLGYGEPLFNFYAQLPYAFGEIFHLIGFQLVDSLKIVFALSLILSGVSMYFLGRKLWQSDLAGVVSAVFYVYAPYRAVDVWVRGALPEALAFVFFPLIILAIEEKKKLWFSLTLALLILTHNLSVVMFLPFVVLWIAYRRQWQMLAASLLSLALAAFYILPVIFESKYIDLAATTTGYFDFRAHFTTVYQTLLSRFWGYGGSTWGPDDGLNLSVGIPQWIVPIVAIACAWFTKKKSVIGKLLVIVSIGWFYLFLTHNKATFIWETLPFTKYIQFPWRFLGQAVFAFSLAAGSLVTLLDKTKAIIISAVLIAVVIGSTFMFFREDIWYSYADRDLTTGKVFEEQTRASIGDYWPNLGHKIPRDPATGEFINYFPGWVPANPDKNGLIRARGAVFTDTWPRTAGNIISLVSLVGFIIIFYKVKTHET